MSDKVISPTSTTASAGRLLVIGLGLIGGSLALAARQRHLFSEVIGASRSPATLDKAIELGVVDRVESDLPAALAALGAGDIVVVGVPTLAVPKIITQLQEYLSPEVSFTDVASVKGSIVAAVKDIYGSLPAQFVPGHPIAGSEKSGVSASLPDLYDDHRVILTPLAETGEAHTARVTAMWQGVGATVCEMPVEEHDEVLAATSHLPHLLAYSLVDTLAGMEENREIFRYAAGGFRDFTRIAASDPTMWHDITLANSSAIVEVLDSVTDHLQSLRTAILAGDSEHLLGVFTRAKEARHHFQIMLDNKAYLQTMGSTEIQYRVEAGGVLQGQARVPGDKSISHRSIMLGSLAEGVTEVSGFLEGEDSLATLQAFRDMGVVIEGPDKGRVVIHGVGLQGLKAPAGPLYLGNSGTSMRLLVGILAGQAFDSVLTGDESLTGRPMKRVADPLALMGAEIETAEGGTPPLSIRGNCALQAIAYRLPMASAQVKSCVLLAGLYANGETRVTEPAPTRDHTERMLRGFGYGVKTDGAEVTLGSGGTLQGGLIDVPSDISSAAFFMVAASIAEGSDITLSHVGINPTRIGVINILRLMGADITLDNERLAGGEPVADIRVRSAALKGIAIPEDQVPLAIDEFPAIFIAAACAEGTTVLTGAEELRVKESDRIQAMADGLAILGISAEPTVDGIVIEGGQLQSGEVDSLGDHRIAMSFAIAGLRASGPILIRNCNNVATSFPGFIDLSSALGLAVSEGKQ
ncbi:bifunctional prephenate dehydrogenase/3-phosphoshikimate 1-carboxyvinyltransferase [Gammaproteobacteria bacterium 53_120_T64]|nr:bifunctional prephenate dehydrogenase/3-phosphoshikimate 1-carboxyvinyltransferase [Gammaproteobacteria bacterium 53_120_T64]